MHNEAQELGLNLEDLQYERESDEQENSPEDAPTESNQNIDDNDTIGHSDDSDHDLDSSLTPSYTPPPIKDPDIQSHDPAPKSSNGTDPPQAPIIADRSQAPPVAPSDTSSQPKRKGRQKVLDTDPRSNGAPRTEPNGGGLDDGKSPKTSSTKGKGKKQQIVHQLVDPAAEAERMNRVVEDVQSKGSKLREKWGDDWTGERQALDRSNSIQPP